MSLVYFSRKAENYLQKTQSFPWKWLKTLERNVLLGELSLDSATILDIGSGPGYYSNYIQKKHEAKITCVDPSQKMLDQINNENIFKICSSLESLRVTQEFDLILIYGVLEFLPKPFAGLQKLSKLNINKSKLHLMVPVSSPLGWLYKLYHQLNGLEIHLFEARSFAEELRRMGFTILSQKKVGLFNRAFLLKYNS